MATLIESEAVFQARLKAMGLERMIGEFSRRGWGKMSTFAFASSWTPGVGDDTSFKNKVLTPLLGSEDHADAPKVRKLYFESYTMVAADLKSKLDVGTEDAAKVKKLPIAERKSRWETVKANYPSLNFQVESMEPAYGIVDKCHAMKVDGEVRYLAPHEIPTRDQELQSVKTEESIKKDASGHLRAHDESKLPEANTKTDLLMRQAYTRRGIALEMADVVTFTKHEKLIDKLFAEHQREPPPGYSHVSLRQVADADRRLWKIMAEGCNGDLGRTAGGDRVGDVLLEAAMQDPAFMTMLLPLPGYKAASSSYEVEEAPTGAGKRKLQKENQKLKERLRALEHAPGPKLKNPKKAPVKMPKALWGLEPMKEGERICFGFNMDGCSHQASNGKCDRGLHVCMRCWKNGHGAQKCPDRK